MLLESNSLLGDIIQLLGRLVVLRGGVVIQRCCLVQTESKYQQRGFSFYVAI